MALYTTHSMYEQYSYDLLSNINTIRKKGYYNLSPKFVKAFNSKISRYSKIMNNLDNKYESKIFRFLNDWQMTGRVYTGSNSYSSIGIRPSASFEVYPSYTVSTDGKISPNNTYLSSVDGGRYLFDWIQPCNNVYQQTEIDYMDNSFNGYPIYTTQTTFYNTENIKSSNTYTDYTYTENPNNDLMNEYTFNSITEFDKDVILPVGSGFAFYGNNRKIGLVEFKTQLYVISENTESFERKIDYYVYIDLMSFLSFNSVNSKDNFVDLYINSTASKGMTNFYTSVFFSYIFNLTIKDLINAEIVIFKKRYSSSSTTYLYTPVLSADDWYSFFKTYLGCYASFNASDYNKPVNQWTFGNKEVDIDDRDVPGSGGQEGGETGGGEGTGDNTSEPIDLGKEATGTSEQTTSYALSYGEIEELNLAFLNGSLWQPILSSSNIFFPSPADAIINLVAFPFNIAQFDEENVTYLDAIKILGVELAYNVGEGATNKISGYKLGHNMKTRIPMGSLEFKEFFGTFLDYDPYTQISLYLPFFGYIPLSATAVMGKKVEIFYNVSYLDGTCLCVVLADNVPIITKEGKIGYELPIIKSDNSTRAINMVANTISTVATSTLSTAGKMAMKEASAEGSTKESINEKAKQGAVIGAITGAGQSGINGVKSLLNQSTISFSGSATGVHGRAMSPIPFVIITRPITNMPNNYNEIAGYQTNLYRKLNDLTGFTACDNVKLDGVNMATEDEKTMIKTMLLNGVIL